MQDPSALPSSSRKRPHSFSVISDPEFENVNNPPKRHMAEMMAHGVQRMISLTGESDDPSTSEGPNLSTARTPTPPAHSSHHRPPSTSSHGALFSRSSGGGRGDDHDIDQAHSMCMSDSLNGAPSLDASVDEEIPRRVSSSAVLSPSYGAASAPQWGRTPPPTFAQSPPAPAHALPPLPHCTGTSQAPHDVSMSGENISSASREMANVPSLSSPTFVPQSAQPAAAATRPLASRRLSDSVFRSLSAGLIVPPPCGMGSVVPKDPAPGASAQQGRTRQAPSPRLQQLSSSQLQMQDLLPPSPSDARFTFADLRKMALLRSTMQREEATNAVGMQADGPCAVEVALMGPHAGLPNARGIDSLPKSPLGGATVPGLPHSLAAPFPLPVLPIDTKSHLSSAPHDPFAALPVSPPLGPPPGCHLGPGGLSTPFLSPSRAAPFPPSLRGRVSSPRAESWMDGTQSGMVSDSSGSGSDQEVEQHARRHQAVVLGPAGIAHVPARPQWHDVSFL